MSGFYLMHRGWRSNPVFKDEPCSEREAWLWLIEEAAYQQRRKRVGSTIVTVERGQIATSTRFIAEAWGWTHSKARRFLERLENEAMIGTSTDTGVTVITLCNYERFQSPDQATDTPIGTEPTQYRHGTDTNEKERNKIKELTKEADASLGADGADDGQPQSDADDPSPPIDQPAADDPSEPTDAELVWGRGLQWLAKSTGKKPNSLRGLVGRWCKGGREAAVLALMRECREHSPPIVDPVPWIETALANRSDANVRQAQQHRPAARSYGEDPAARRPGVLDGLAHRLDPSGAAAAGGSRPTAGAGRVG